MGGTGKTTQAYNLIFGADHDFLFVFDHDGQFSQRNRTRTCETPDEILREIKRSGVIVFSPSRMYLDRIRNPKLTERQKERALHDVAVWFCRYVFEMAFVLPGKSLFFCDELQKLCKFSNPWLTAILEEGRNRALDFGCCTLHLGSIDLPIRNQFTVRYVFKIEERGALRYLEENGFNASEVFSLPKFHFIMRDSHTGRMERGKVCRLDLGTPWTGHGFATSKNKRRERRKNRLTERRRVLVRSIQS